MCTNSSINLDRTVLVNEMFVCSENLPMSFQSPSPATIQYYSSQVQNLTSGQLANLFNNPLSCLQTFDALGCPTLRSDATICIEADLVAYDKNTPAITVLAKLATQKELMQQITSFLGELNRYVQRQALINPALQEVASQGGELVSLRPWASAKQSLVLYANSMVLFPDDVFFLESVDISTDDANTISSAIQYTLQLFQTVKSDISLNSLSSLKREDYVTAQATLVSMHEQFGSTLNHLLSVLPVDDSDWGVKFPLYQRVMSAYVAYSASVVTVYSMVELVMDLAAIHDYFTGAVPSMPTELNTTILVSMSQTTTTIIQTLQSQVNDPTVSALGFSQISTYKCWISFLTQRTDALASYLNAGSLPDASKLGDVNFCVFMNFRLARMRLEAVSAGDCVQLTDTQKQCPVTYQNKAPTTSSRHLMMLGYLSEAAINSPNAHFFVHKTAFKLLPVPATDMYTPSPDPPPATNLYPEFVYITADTSLFSCAGTTTDDTQCDPGYYCYIWYKYNLTCQLCPQGTYLPQDSVYISCLQCTNAPAGATYPPDNLLPQPPDDPNCPYFCGARLYKTGPPTDYSTGQQCVPAAIGFYSTPLSNSQSPCTNGLVSPNGLVQYLSNGDQNNCDTIIHQGLINMSYPGLEFGTQGTTLSLFAQATSYPSGFSALLTMGASWDFGVLTSAGGLMQLQVNYYTNASDQLYTSVTSDPFSISIGEMVYYAIVFDDNNNVKFYTNDISCGIRALPYVAPWNDTNKYMFLGGRNTPHIDFFINAIMWQEWSVPLVFQSPSFTEVHVSVACDPRTGFLCNTQCVFCAASLGFVPIQDSCSCACPSGFSECGGKCVETCYDSFTFNENCECGCDEGEISMWNFRYLNISSQFSIANPNNGYDITKDIGLMEVFVFDENGKYIRPISCSASSSQSSLPCTNLYDTFSDTKLFLTPLDNLSIAGAEWQTTTGYGWVMLDFGSHIIASQIAIQNSYFGMKEINMIGSSSGNWVYQVVNSTTLAQNTTSFFTVRPSANFVPQSSLQCVACPNQNPNLTASLEITSISPYNSISNCVCFSNLTYSLTRYGCFNIDPPVVRPQSGEYWATPPITVTVTYPAGIATGTFYYTTDGTLPTEKSLQFQPGQWGPPIGSSVFQVIVSVPGRPLSDVARIEYFIFTDLVPNITAISATPGVMYESSFQMIVNCSTNAPDYTIYYALQSNISLSKMNTNFEVYQYPVNVSVNNLMIEAVTFFGYCYAGYRNSSIANYSVLLYPTIPQVTFSPTNSTFSVGAQISLNCNMENTTIKYLVTTPADPVGDFETSSILYNTSNPLQLSCTLTEGDNCNRSISAQAQTWWGNSIISQDSIRIEFTRLAPIITLLADEFYSGVHVTISVGIVFIPTNIKIYYLIDSYEDVAAKNGILYIDTFFYTVLGNHTIKAKAYFGSLESAQTESNFVITLVSVPPVIFPTSATASGSISVTIEPKNALDTGGLILYSVNSTANKLSTLYNGTFKVFPPFSTNTLLWNVTVNAVVVEPGKAISAQASGHYTIVPKCAPPITSPVPGKYYYQVTISMTCGEGCSARFTIAPDPPPTTTSELFGTPHTYYNTSEYNNVTLLAICTHSIYNTSDTTPFEYLVYSKRRPDPPTITFIDDPTSSTKVALMSNLTDPTTYIAYYYTSQSPNDAMNSYNVSLFTNTYYFPFEPSKGPTAVYSIVNLLPGSTFDAPSFQSIGYYIILNAMQVTITPYNVSVHSSVSITVTSTQAGIVIFYCLSFTVSPQTTHECSPSSVSIYSSPIKISSSALFCIRAAGNYFYSTLNSTCSYYDFDGKDGSSSQDSSKGGSSLTHGSGVGWLILLLLLLISVLAAVGYVAFKHYRTYQQRKFIREQLNNGFDIMQDEF